METKCTKFKNTGEIDEIAYEKFVKKQMKSFKKQWDFFNPDEPLTEIELGTKTEDYCKSYRHQFRIYEKVV